MAPFTIVLPEMVKVKSTVPLTTLSPPRVADAATVRTTAGTGGLSIILGNEAQTIACSATGAATAALDITIPFTGYVGITQAEQAIVCASFPRIIERPPVPAAPGEPGDPLLPSYSDITYTLVRNAENAKLAYVTADTYVFKYNTSSALVGASQATLSAHITNVSNHTGGRGSQHIAVDFQNSSGNFLIRI